MLIKEPSDLKRAFENYVITSIQDIQDIIEPIQMLKNSTALKWFESYRGQGMDTWSLEPQLIRETKDIAKIRKIESELYSRFKLLKNGEHSKYISNSISSGSSTIFETPWFDFFQMQHLGFKTRLLDWSLGWKIALYFAASNPKYDGVNGQFWVFFHSRDITFNHMEILQRAAPRYLNIDPYNVEGTMFLNPHFPVEEEGKLILGTRRRLVQSGRFSIQKYEDSILPLEKQPIFDQCLIKMIVDGNSKIKIRNELDSIGINSDKIYYKTINNLDQEIKEINEEVLLKYK